MSVAVIRHIQCDHADCPESIAVVKDGALPAGWIPLWNYVRYGLFLAPPPADLHLCPIHSRGLGMVKIPD